MWQEAMTIKGHLGDKECNEKNCTAHINVTSGKYVCRSVPFGKENPLPNGYVAGEWELAGICSSARRTDVTKVFSVSVATDDGVTVGVTLQERVGDAMENLQRATRSYLEFLDERL